MATWCSPFTGERNCFCGRKLMDGNYCILRHKPHHIDEGYNYKRPYISLRKCHCGSYMDDDTGECYHNKSHINSIKCFCGERTDPYNGLCKWDHHPNGVRCPCGKYIRTTGSCVKNHDRYMPKCEKGHFYTMDGKCKCKPEIDRFIFTDCYNPSPVIIPFGDRPFRTVRHLVPLSDEEQIRTVIKYFAQPQVAWIELSGKILTAEKEM